MLKKISMYFKNAWYVIRRHTVIVLKINRINTRHVSLKKRGNSVYSRNILCMYVVFVEEIFQSTAHTHSMYFEYTEFPCLFKETGYVQ